MRKIVISLLGLFLVGCSTLPETLLRKDKGSFMKVSDFELCRAAFDYDITNRRKNNSPMPNEMARRNLDGNSCFNVLLDEHGVDEFCSRYNRMIAMGEPDALIGFATNLSRKDLETGLQLNEINCYTNEYLSNFASDSSSNAEVEAINGFFNSLNEGIKNQQNNTSSSFSNSYSEPPQTTTTCREYIDGSVRCKSKTSI